MNPFCAPTTLRPHARNVSILPMAAALLLAMGLGSQTQASPCLGEAAGNPALNCTAKDFGVASVTVDTLLDDGCQFEGDTFTFNGSLNLTASSARRYDVGFYIGDDGTQAYTGNCTVGLIPPGTGTADDGDTCGDFDGAALTVPVQNASSICTDTNGDGFFDLALCASWDQNTKATCNSIEDAIPGTSAKCGCSQVETNQAVPICLTNADCASDGNVCTDEICDPGGAGADFLGCTHPANTASCDNGLFCDGADVCTDGTCGHFGDPCIGGGICGDNCNEAADNCFATIGTVCRSSNGACDLAETCTGSTSACPGNAFLSGTCRASTGACDAAESCSGSSTDCPADGLVAAGTICRSDAGDCDIAETCTGSSTTCPADAFEAAGTTCTSDAEVCTDDVCDAAGACTHENNTAACDDGLFCTVGDACTGGTCAGAPRDCTDSMACTVGSCDESTDLCVQLANDFLCDDANACTLNSCAISQGGCVSENICGTDICRSAGYWSTHSGYEKANSVNVGQLVLDAVGPLDVCGESISTTSNLGAPYVDGLGLTSDLEGLCMRVKGEKQRQLYRQLTAAALNCAVSGGDCDAILANYVDVSFTECSNLCEGLPTAEGAPTVSQCVRQLDCFNNGGQTVDGKCALGTCAIDPSRYCGSKHGACPNVDSLPQECVEFENNCHAADLCNEDIGVCPPKTRASSPAACREARFNDCTIDSCN